MLESSYYEPQSESAPRWTVSMLNTVGWAHGYLRKPDWGLEIERALGRHWSIALSGVIDLYREITPRSR